MIMLDPAHRLQPSPRRDRPWRILLPLLAGLVGLFLVAALATQTAVSWAQQDRYPPVTATHELGTPSSLELSSRFADVTVQRSADVDQVTLALVSPGSTTLPAAGATARAAVETRGSAEAVRASVREPGMAGPVPWQSEDRDVLVLVPEDLDLRLSVTTDLGDITASGRYTSLSARTDTGDVALDDIATSGAVTVKTSVGDIDLRMRPDTHSPLRVSAETGDVSIAVPGKRQYDVSSHASVGDEQIEPGVQAAPGAEASPISANADVGDVTITR